jgi:hypothetical protein
LVSVSFTAGGAGVEGFLVGGVSDFGGFAPFIVSIPSTVTVLPSGSFSVFSSFFVPNKGKLEHEVNTKRDAIDKTKMPAMNFLFWVIKSPCSHPSSSLRLEGAEEGVERLVLYYQFW